MMQVPNKNIHHEICLIYITASTWWTIHNIKPEVRYAPVQVR